MSRSNVPLLSFNRGLLSPKALARVDLDRTRLSAEVMTNLIPAAQGSMSIRPGTKYMGSVASDTGAEFVEFVASTDDVALLELTHDTGTGDGRMRVWMGDDAHNLALLSRPHVDTQVSLSDTGWSDESEGGALELEDTEFNAIPEMTGPTTAGITISSSSNQEDFEPWHVADDDDSTAWLCDGALPQWWMIDFGIPTAIVRYELGMPDFAFTNMPSAWTLQGNDVDTGTGWVTEDSRTSQTGWGAGEVRSYTAQSDTGETAYRYWRLNITAQNGSGEMGISDIALYKAPPPSGQVDFGSRGVSLNATARGALARVSRHVIVSDTGTEHSLVIRIGRGPVVLRVGSSEFDDDYISETALGTGDHNLSFTPLGNFYVTLQTSDVAQRIVSSVSIGDSGTVEIPTPWSAEHLDNIRYDQSADVVYVDCRGVQQHKIERRGTGRSWSVVEYAPNDGPFLTAPSSSARLRPNGFYGNIQIRSDVPYFQPGHVGSLVRMFHSGQTGVWALGEADAVTDAVEVNGIGDTGTDNDIENERRIVFNVSGNYAGLIAIERSFDGPDFGFRKIPPNIGTATDTGTFEETIDDPDDNIRVWYRARISDHTSGVAIVRITYEGGGTTGIARVTGYNNNQEVDAEVIARFGDTGPTDNWQEGWWSERRGYPTAVALHGGRLFHAGGANVFGSVSDDYESFDETVEGDAGPIVKTLGSGPVDSVHYVISLLRLIIGTAGAEIAVRSSSLDEPLTPTNSNAIAFSTQGSAPLRGLKMDTRAIMVQRSRQRVFMLGANVQGAAFGDYEGLELTLLVPDLLTAKVRSIAIQRQPDTRIHFALEDGRVAIMTYEPTEEVLAWYLWETDGSVERVAVLPGIEEDAVFYLVNRTINGQTKRYIEKWAKESECVGDTGLTWLMDCAVAITDTGRSNAISAPHLAGEQVVAWGNDTGTGGGKDLSPGWGSGQTLYQLDTGRGDGTINEDLHHKVVGLPYSATWKSTKLAYAAQAGTALAQMKKASQLALLLYKTHNDGIQFGGDTGQLDSLPRVDQGAVVDPDLIYETYDRVAVSFPGGWNEDARLVLKASAPRPATVMAAIPTVVTHEKV